MTKLAFLQNNQRGVQTKPFGQNMKSCIKACMAKLIRQIMCSGLLCQTKCSSSRQVKEPSHGSRHTGRAVTMAMRRYPTLSLKLYLESTKLITIHLTESEKILYSSQEAVAVGPCRYVPTGLFRM